MKLTPARRRALEYIRDNEPVKLFPVNGPSLSLVKKMANEGLIDRVAPSAFGFIRFTLSDAGRLALGASHDE